MSLSFPFKDPVNLGKPSEKQIFDLQKKVSHKLFHLITGYETYILMIIPTIRNIQNDAALWQKKLRYFNEES